MNQGSNFKQQVMEALFNAPTNLINNKAIMWAASNLPDEGGKGEYNTTLRGPYNHDAESFWTAIGMPDEDMDRINDKFCKTLAEYAADNQNNPDARKSMAFQYIESKLGAEGILFMAVHGFVKHYENLQVSQVKELSLSDLSGIVDSAPEEIKALLKHLIDIKKKLGGEK
jgi:hypothetical protein